MDQDTAYDLDEAAMLLLTVIAGSAANPVASLREAQTAIGRVVKELDR